MRLLGIIAEVPDRLMRSSELNPLVERQTGFRTKVRRTFLCSVKLILTLEQCPTTFVREPVLLFD